MNSAELDNIRKMDTARRALQSDDLIKLALAYYGAPDDYHASRGITGIPSNKNRVVRATDDCWTNHYYHDATGALKSVKTRVVGGDVTVIHADGTTEIRAASSFRKESIHRKQRTHAKEIAIDAANKARHVVTAADLAPIGNVE